MITQSDAIDFLKMLPGSDHNVLITDPDWGMDYDWKTFLAECMRVTALGSTLIMWNAAPAALFRLLNIAKEVGYKAKHIFPWIKPNGSNPTGWGISRRWEAIVWFDNKKGRRGELKFLADTWVVPRVTSVSRENLGHRWQKPRDLCEILVRGFSRPGDMIIDTFVGTGVILAEAKARDRLWKGCDIDQRWATLSQALLEGTPMPRLGDMF